MSDNIGFDGRESPGMVSLDLPDLVTDSDDDFEQTYDSNVEISVDANYTDSDDESDSDSSSARDSSPSASSDTDDDISFDGNNSDDSSIGDYEAYGGELGVLEILNRQLEAFSELPSTFQASLQMLYDRLAEHFSGFAEDPKPTPQHILDSLNKVKITFPQVASKTSCCICFCEYTQDEEALQLPCNHIYHNPCILNWLKIKSTCPTCRLDLTEYYRSNDRRSEASSSSATNSSEDVEFDTPESESAVRVQPNTNIEVRMNNANVNVSTETNSTNITINVNANPRRRIARNADNIPFIPTSSIETEIW